MRKLTFMKSAPIALAGCGNSMGGALEDVDSWEEDMMEISLEKFNVMAVRSGLVGAFGNQREITDEEMAMFRSHTDDGGEIVYTPLSVSTQVVAALSVCKKNFSVYEAM